MNPSRKYAGGLPALLALVLCITGGCIELQNALTSTGPGSPGGGSPPTGPDAPADDDASSDVPAVTLSVSNPNPLVGEEVVLICSTTGERDVSVTFDFQPADPRLEVNHQTGRAGWIVDASDVGAEIAFTCTATSEAGSSERSNEVLMLPGA